jgi:hypothetical protein
MPKNHLAHSIDEGGEVVLISFPYAKMKTLAFVTHILADEATGKKLAIVRIIRQ